MRELGAWLWLPMTTRTWPASCPRWRRSLGQLGPTHLRREHASSARRSILPSSLLNGTGWTRDSRRLWRCRSITPVSSSPQEGQREDHGRPCSVDEGSAEGQTAGTGHPRHLGPHHPADWHVQLHRPEPWVTTSDSGWCCPVTITVNVTVLEGKFLRERLWFHLSCGAILCPAACSQ